MIKEWAEQNDKFHRLAKFSGLPEVTYKTHQLDTFKPATGTRAALAAARAFIKGAEHNFIALGGEPGRGKTHLAFGIGWAWLDGEKGLVKYWRVSNLLEEMRAWYKKEHAGDVKSPIDWAKTVDLLILDDLGAEKPTEWAMERLDDIVDHRYLNALGTIFTTNLNFSQMPPRIASRIKEGITILLEGPDYREIKAKQRKRGE